MASIIVEREHGLASADSARELLVSMEEGLKDRYGVTLSWRGNSATVAGKGVSGSFAVDDGRIRIELKLGMLLRPLKGKIQGSIERSVDRALAQAGAGS